ncbi:MAG TPA: hypothetical protein VJP77_09545, partial [Planctomycetota bacterium]|nr:hypothetical protein [Planctomycetota bacterium]
EERESTAERAAVALPAVAGAPVAVPAPAEAAEALYRVVVVDERGVEHWEESGTLSVLVELSRPNVISTYEVAVDLGRTRLPRSGFLGVARGRLGGRTVLQNGVPSRLAPASTEPLVLRTAWTPQIALRVLAADTGEDLAGFEYRVSQSPLYRGAPPPGTVVGAAMHHGDSPIALDADAFPGSTGVLRVDARAPGYAWGALALDLRVPGERRLELRPSGHLAVALEGGAPELGPGHVVRVRPAGVPDELLAELLLDARRDVELRDLPSGPVDVEVVIGRYAEEPILRGRVAAVVQPGVVVPVTVALAPLEVPESVPLAGTLVQPMAWGRPPGALVISTRGAFASGGNRSTHARILGPVEGPDATYTWNAGRVEPGRYAVSLTDGAGEPWLHFLLDLAPPGRTDVAIVVPQPAEALVRTVRAATDEPARFDLLTVTGSLQEGQSAAFEVHAPYDFELGGHLVRAPVGEVRVFENVSDQGFLPPTTLVLPPGRSEHVLEVVEPIALELRLRDAGVEIPFAVWETVARPVGHAGRASRPTSLAGIATVFVDRPGR